MALLFEALFMLLGLCHIYHSRERLSFNRRVIDNMAPLLCLHSAQPQSSQGFDDAFKSEAYSPNMRIFLWFPERNPCLLPTVFAKRFSHKDCLVRIEMFLRGNVHKPSL